MRLLERESALADLGAALAAAVAVEIRSWPLLLLGCVPFGAATATNLAARYAGTDLAAPHRRAEPRAGQIWP